MVTSDFSTRELNHSHSRADDEHFSSTLPTGSCIFIVQGKTFMIPKALLVLESAVFEGIDQDVESLEPTVLDDSAEAFRDFVDHIYYPTELYSKPSLKTVLNVLRIANKYCAANIEKVAASIAEKLTGSNLASHLSEKLTHIDVFRTGNTVQNAKVTKNAWSLILDDFRAGKLSARSFLDAARHSQDANFLVSAYYQIMLRGVRSWEKDQDLSNDECRRLTRGFARCCEEWDAFVSRLSVGDFDIPQYLLPKQNINEIGDGVSDQGINVLTDVSSKNKTTPTRNLYEIVEVMARQHTEKGLRCWDIIGRLKAMEHLKLPWNWNVYKDELGKCCEGTLSIIETSCLASFFLLDAHNGSEDN